MTSNVARGNCGGHPIDDEGNPVDDDLGDAQRADEASEMIDREAEAGGDTGGKYG